MFIYTIGDIFGLIVIGIIVVGVGAGFLWDLCRKIWRGF